MVDMEYAISMIDGILNTKRKRHITGGILLSLSLLFAGLTFTVATIKDEQLKEIGYER